MNEPEKIEKQLADFAAENELELEDIELPDDKELNDIKADKILLAECYIKYFNAFESLFYNCPAPGVSQYIEMHQKIFNELFTYLSKSVVFKSLREKSIENCVNDNHRNIVGLINLYERAKDE